MSDITDILNSLEADGVEQSQGVDYDEIDPQFSAKIRMSHYISEQTGTDANSVFEDYEGISSAYGFSGDAEFDLSFTKARLHRVQDARDPGFFESSMGRIKAGGLRASQFTDALQVVMLQAPIERTRRDIERNLDQAELHMKKGASSGSREFGESMLRLAEENKIKLEGLKKNRDDQIEDYVRKQIKILAQPVSNRLKAFRDTKGLEGAAKLINPLTLAEVLTEEMIAVSPSLAITIGGGVAGGPKGAIAGAGLGAYAQGVSANFFDYLGQQGVDTSSQEALQAALDDKQLFNDAISHAMLKSTPEAVASAISVGVADKGKALTNALVTQPSIAGAGVLGANLIMGEDIDIKDLITEMVAELPGGTVEVVSMRLLKPTDEFKRKILTDVPANNKDVELMAESTSPEAVKEGTSPEESAVIDKMIEGDPRAEKLVEQLTGKHEQAEAMGLTDDQLVGLSNAEMETLRKSSAEDGFSDGDVQTNAETVRRAKEQGQDTNTRQIIDRIKDGQAVNPEEYAGLGLRLTRLTNDMDDVSADIQTRIEAGQDVDPSLISTRQSLAEEMIELTDAMHRAGETGARAQQLRQMFLNREDFTPQKLIRDATNAKGKELSPEEKSQFNQLSSKIQKLQSTIRRLNRQIKKLGEGKIDKATIDEVVRARIDEFREKNKVRKAISQFEYLKRFRERNIFGKIFQVGVETAALSRTLKTIGDFSAWLRQGFPLALGRPLNAGKAIMQSLDTVLSEEKFVKSYLDLISSDLWPEMRELGLYLSPAERIELSSREEQFSTNVIEALPGILRRKGAKIAAFLAEGPRQIALASERNMVTYLNSIRFAAMADFLAKHPDAPRHVKEEYAKYINAASGRGSLFALEGAARGLSIIFFAPRFAASRIEAPIRALALLRHKETRMAVAKDWAAFATTGMTVLSFAALAGAEVELEDPLSSDFGKIKIGDTRIDMFAGFQQSFRLTMAYGLAGADRAGLKELGKDIDLSQATMQFLKYKAAPTATIPWELLTGKDLVGNEASLLDTARTSLLPLFLNDTYEVFVKEKSPSLSALTLGLTSIGVGVSTHESRDIKKKSSDRAR